MQSERLSLVYAIINSTRFKHAPYVTNTAGEVACFASHVLAWLDVASGEEQSEYVLVVEDDAVPWVSCDSAEIGAITSAIARAAQSKRPETHIPWIALGTSASSYHRLRSSPLSASQPGVSWGTTAYLMSPRGARLLLKCIDVDMIHQLGVDLAMMAVSEAIGYVGGSVPHTALIACNDIRRNTTGCWVQDALWSTLNADRGKTWNYERNRTTYQNAVKRVVERLHMIENTNSAV